MTDTQRDSYFFGCVERSGHYMHDVHGHHVYDDCAAPWKDFEIDCKLQPGCYYDKGRECWRHPGHQPEGLARLHHKDGWTALSFWDRSIDKRGGCNGTFIIEGEHSFDRMCQLAAERFPEIWRRFTFQIRLPEEPS